MKKGKERCVEVVTSSRKTVARLSLEFLELSIVYFRLLNDPDVKGEIERRLKLLEPDLMREKVCVSCGTTFAVDRRKRFRQNSVKIV